MEEAIRLTKQRKALMEAMRQSTDANEIRQIRERITEINKAIVQLDLTGEQMQVLGAMST